MRKLHLVGLTTDRDGLIFTARKGSKSGGFIVPLDDRVLAAIAEAREGPNGAPAAADPEAGEVETVPKRLRSQSALTPREMQARLRAGRSIDEVAAEAGVDNEWVARFAVPILAEQAQVVELARSLVYAKPRLGESSQPLGASVVQNLSDRGIFIPDDVANTSWGAFQLHDSVWMVRFRYRSRGRDQEAQWEIDVPTGRLMARNRHASDLGYVDPLRRRRDVDVTDDPLEDEPEAAVVAPPRPRRQAGTAKVAAKRATPPRVPARAAKSAAPAKAPRARRPATPATTSSASKAVRPAKASRQAKAAKTAGAAKRAERAVAVTRGRAKTAPPKAAPRSPAAKSPGRKSPAAKSPAAKAPAKNSTATKRPPAAPAPATAGPARSPSRRRPAKAAPPADAGPTGGTGGVRMAVQQVSTARVAASLAAAERAPWAGAVERRPARGSGATGGDSVERARSRRPPPRPSPVEADLERPARGDGSEDVPTFQPRPLPAGKEQPVASRVRKVTPARTTAVPDGPPTMSLPARHVPMPPTEAPPGERPKRRRLRSR